MPKSLVTGGAGFIGSHVAEELLKLGHEVYILDDLSDGYVRNVPKRATLMEGSVTDSETVDYVLRAFQPDYVFHFAAYVAEHMSHYCRRFNYEVNVLGSMNLINASIQYGVKRFVYISSMSVYNVDQMPASEDDTPRPADPYGIAKYAVEQDLRSAYERFGLEYTIFRPHNVYGERCNLANPYRNVIAIFLRQCLTGQPMTIYGDGSQTRQFSYVRDIAPVIAASAEELHASQRIFNLGDDVSYRISYIAEKVAQEIGVPFQAEYWPERVEAKRLEANHYRVDSLWPHRTKTNLAVGLTNTAQWARTITDLTPRPFTAVELNDYVPEALRYG